MHLFYLIRDRVRSMPAGLRVATFLCLLFSGFAPLSLVPLRGAYSVGGVLVGFEEFWRRGGGPIFFGLGVVCASLAYGFLRARSWSRSVFVLAIIAINLPVGYGVRPATAKELAMSVVIIASAYWYVFHRRPVKEYFSKPHDCSA